ncbi:bifunctional ADP-dependent NAD(P)H-hydrate dehydratase/NAD(P)H-hydrate epimerase [Methylobacterium sp. 77]|uniref:bifunctional ADP-dependent NAD(P)H-hydrate dehydratase/NAD(P)H-hydrate epimerase n=1 Tax=Methylobacterium sp. 77 TaxID=1101192 RepID=UPI0003A78CA8|nr:bifunctional ADP-dependent NAD(P)H-hydrate dehydratase/NAD(P)H-hydrate epimerase [Methylobacterium sp. 77]
MPTHRLFTVEAMRRLDAAAIAAGTPGIELMRRAGAAVAETATGLVAALSRILVLCGPGNNGGDGFVAARLLERDGHVVNLVCTVPVESLTGDAALAAAEWEGPVLYDAEPEGAALVIDALFGAGLSRDLDGLPRMLIERVAAAGVPVLAIDVPSGIDGDTGALRGIALKAVATVTFVALKPGHLLQPGRSYCGDLHVADIGMADVALDSCLDGTPLLCRNGPDLWEDRFPKLEAGSHKYTRGHVLALSGPAYKTGAIRLAARAALRIGAGLVTIASPAAAMAENAAHLTAIMLTPCETADDLDDLLVDERLNVILAGPGLGSGEATRERVAVAAGVGRSLVLDADALTSFKGEVAPLSSLIADGGGQAVLTPHAGEFGRLLAGTDAVDPQASKLEGARRAAALIGAVVVLKGADTVIAAPDGRAAINDHATPYLGTAGSGDVLAGLVAGLLAQGMPPFEAACAAVWLHGDAGLRHGPGLIAEDLPEMMPRVLAGLR